MAGEKAHVVPNCGHRLRASFRSAIYVDSWLMRQERGQTRHASIPSTAASHEREAEAPLWVCAGSAGET
jgi:hypothetical protein